MKEKIFRYKKIGEEIEKVIKHHEETVDEKGNVIPAYDEEVEVVKSIYGDVYEEMEVKDLPQEELHHQEPTQLDVIEAQTMYTALMTDTLLEV